MRTTARKEVWRPVVGFESHYEVSSFGRVRRSAPGRGTRVGRINKQCANTHGYLHVGLSTPGKRTTLRVHALVADAFLGPLPIGKERNHRNGVKTDNRARNLEFVTTAENARHARRLGLQPTRRAARPGWLAHRAEKAA